MADLLKQKPDADIRVFVVWEPVLLTDWRRPGESQTSYLPDARAVHFWDPDHRLSAMYGGVPKLDALAARKQIGFRMKNVVWDAALFYPPGVRWGQQSSLLVAPVVKFKDDLAREVR